MFWWKTWASILRLFHGEDIVFLTCRAAVFRLRVGLTVVLRWSYSGLMIQVTENCLELSTHKGRVSAGDGQDRAMVGESKKLRKYERIKISMYEKSNQNDVAVGNGDGSMCEYGQLQQR